MTFRAVYDEPTVFLDLRARLMVARTIAGTRKDSNYVLVADLDLMFMESACDEAICITGEPNIYGVVNTSRPFQEGKWTGKV